MPLADDHLSLVLLAVETAHREGERGPLVAVTVDEDAPPISAAQPERAEAFWHRNIVLAGESGAVSVMPIELAKLVFQDKGADVERELALPEVPGWIRVVVVHREGPELTWIEVPAKRAAEG